MLGLGAGVYYDLGHLEKAAKVLENSRELYDKQYSEESPSYADPCSYLSVIHHQLGNFTRSKEMADKVYMLFGNATNISVEPGTHVLCCDGLYFVYINVIHVILTDRSCMGYG